MRRAARVDANHHALVLFARSLGATVTTLQGDPSDPGRPDVVVGFRGRNLLWEFKTDVGELSKQQVAWHARWRGSAVTVIRTERDVVDALNAV